MGGRGIGSQPVLLDLSGNGLAIDTLATSKTFLDMDGDGYQRRTAWASAGTGVLVLDADGDGKISRSSEFAFTEWDSSADSDLEALRRVFDTNNNNKLDAGDARWGEFKVSLNGNLYSMASQSLASIDLIATGSGQRFEDGSAITGTAKFTRTSGATGAVGDATLAAEADSHIVARTTAANGDGSRTTTTTGSDKDGSLAFREVATVSADGLSTVTQFDDDGDGAFDRSQGDARSTVSGIPQRVVSNFNVDGSLDDRTTTATETGGLLRVTTTVDQDGDGAGDQRQIAVTYGDGSSFTDLTRTSADGTVTASFYTASSANGLVRTTYNDADGQSGAELTTTETTSIANGVRTTVEEDRAADATRSRKQTTIVSADGLSKSVAYDRDNDHVDEIAETSVVGAGANGYTVTTATTTAATGLTLGRTVSAASRDGLVRTRTTTVDGQADSEIVETDVTSVFNGALSRTVQSKSHDGALLGAETTDTSADRKLISIATDADGDGSVDAGKTIAISADGATTTSTLNRYAPDGSLVAASRQEWSAAAGKLIDRTDADGNGAYEAVTTDIVTTNASTGERTRTVSTRLGTITVGTDVGALVGRTATTTSADSRTVTVRRDLDGDGLDDRRTSDVKVLYSDGMRARTVDERSANGALLSRASTYTSPDRKTVTTTTDLDGDQYTNLTTVDAINANGSRTVTATDRSNDGAVLSRTETTISANGLTIVVKDDRDNGGGFETSLVSSATINANGGATTTVSAIGEGPSPLLLSKTVTTASANGLRIDSQTDANGDGAVEARSTDVTTPNANGSTTRTVSTLTGTGVLLAKSVATTSASGLLSSLSVDEDGNATLDRVATDATVLAANGSRTETVEVRTGAGALLSNDVTLTSSDRRSITRDTDLNGDASKDERRVTAILDDGATSATTYTYNAGGGLTSRAQAIVSADGLVRSLAVDADGNGATNRSVSDTTLLTSDGGTTRTVISSGSVNEKTTIQTDAGGLRQTTTWSAMGAAVTRKQIATTVFEADGDTTRTVEYRNALNSLEGKTVTATRSDGLVRSFTRDDSGDGVADLTVTTERSVNGNVVETRSGRNAPVSGTSSSGNKVTITSANGLWIWRTFNRVKAADGAAYIGSQSWDYTSLDAMGATTQRITYAVADGNFNAVIADGAVVETSGNGMSIHTNWNLDGNESTVEKSRTDDTVLDADGRTVQTVKDYSAGLLVSNKVTTTDVRDQSVSTSWDFSGPTIVSGGSSDVTIVNPSGSKARTVTSNWNGSFLSRYAATTSADGRAVTTNEDIDGQVGFDRVRKRNVLTAADGAVIERLDTTSTAGILYDRQVTTAAADGRRWSITRDADGDGRTDQTETRADYVDGSSRTVITDIAQSGGAAGVTTIATSADGLKTTSEWDFDGNGVVDQNRVTTQTDYADGSQRIRSEDRSLPANTLISAVETMVGADGRTRTTKTDVNGIGGDDRAETVVTHIDGSVTRTISNAAAARDTSLLVPGEVYFIREISRSITSQTSADGLKTVVTSDYDTNAGDYDTDYIATSQTRIDGSVVTAIAMTNHSPVVVASVQVTVSADGLTTALVKDEDNDGDTDHTEKAVKRIDGSVNMVAVDYKPDHSIDSTTSTVVSADTKSTAVLLEVGSTGSGTATGIGVEFTAAGSTNDTITGSIGDDHILGGSGIDRINGQAGSDVIDGGAGADQMAGGAGNDTFVVDDGGDAVSESSNEGIDTILSSISYAFTDSDVENLTLTGAAATGTGNALANVMTGNGTNNTLSGLAGNDELYGNAGDDTLVAADGDDALTGGAGEDQARGEAGDDYYFYRRGDGGDLMLDYLLTNIVTSQDTAAANSVGINAGNPNVWNNGYLGSPAWDTLSSSWRPARTRSPCRAASPHRTSPSPGAGWVTTICGSVFPRVRRPTA